MGSYVRRFCLIAISCVVFLFSSEGTAFAQYGGFLTVNRPLSGVFAPNLPIDASGKPFIDYTFVVSVPGTYQIDLVSSNTSVYDPYLVVMNGPARVATNDDGGSGFNSRIVTVLNPGQYTVRVTRFGSGPISVPFLSGLPMGTCL